MGRAVFLILFGMVHVCVARADFQDFDATRLAGSEQPQAVASSAKNITEEDTQNLITRHVGSFFKGKEYLRGSKKLSPEMRSGVIKIYTAEIKELEDLCRSRGCSSGKKDFLCITNGAICILTTKNTKKR